MTTEGPFVVMTMCHCDEHTDDGEPDCYDHWAVGIVGEGARYDPESGHISRASDMTEGFRTRQDAQMFADAKNGVS